MDGTNPFRLDGRRVLVTGASSDIGRAIAIACADAGADLIVTGRDAGRLAGTCSALAGNGEQIAIQADLTNSADRERLADLAGPLDGFVHAAAIADPMLLRSLTSDYVHQRLELNYVAPMLLLKAQFARHGVRDGGSIVFISSISAHAGTRAMSVYAATKAAQVASARCLALELAPRRIRANCISPAIVVTSVYETLGEKWLDEQAKRYPLGLGRPQDVAHAALFLLADASRWITGQALLLDGACPWV